MKPLKVEWFPQPGLAEIYQKTGYQFAFLSAPKDGNKQCCPWVLCRDFLQDAVAAYVNKGSCSIYSFTYQYGKNPPLDMQRTRMLVQKKNLKPGKEGLERFRRELKAGQALVNHYEDLAGVSLSTMKKVTDDKKNVWRFRGPGVWMRSPFLISMYSFLIRIGDKMDVIDGFKGTDDLVKRFEQITKLKNTGDDHDIGYMKSNFDKMHLLMKNLDSLLFDGGKSKYDKNFSHPTGTMHNRCGIWSLCGLNSPDQKLNAALKALWEESKKK